MYYLNSIVFADPPPKFCEVSSSIWFYQESLCAPPLSRLHLILLHALGVCAQARGNPVFRSDCAS